VKGLFMPAGAALMVGACCACYAQQMPDVSCRLQNYALTPGNEVQVVILRDPSGEQEARFDLTHGAALVSLRYRGQELLYGHSVGANVQMYQIRHGKELELKGLNPFWSAFNPDQGEPSMDVPSTVAGVACHGREWMNAFAMMVDAGADNSFQRQPLLGIWKGQLSGHFPPGYTTRYAIETQASWMANPGRTPSYYLRLDQTVVNVGDTDAGTMHWLLFGTVPWKFGHWAAAPGGCTEKIPCRSSATPVISAGRYQDAADTQGVAVVVPTTGWATDRIYLSGGGDPIGDAPEELKRDFGVTLTHALPGGAGIEFQWYLCAGSWDEAQAFATKMKTGH